MSAGETKVRTTRPKRSDFDYGEGYDRKALRNYQYSVALEEYVDYLESRFNELKSQIEDKDEEIYQLECDLGFYKDCYNKSS